MLSTQNKSTRTVSDILVIFNTNVNCILETENVTKQTKTSTVNKLFVQVGTVHTRLTRFVGAAKNVNRFCLQQILNLVITYALENSKMFYGQEYQAA